MASVKDVRTYRKRIKVGFEGLVNSVDESIAGLEYAVNCKNFAFEKGVINGKIGIDTAGGHFNTDIYYDTHVYPTFAADKGIKKAFYFRRKDSTGALDDRIVCVLSDGTVWNTKIFAIDTWHQFENFTVNYDSDAVNYNYKSEDVLLVADEQLGMFIVRADRVSYLDKAPKLTSIAVHNERVFGTLNEKKNQVWFSDDFDPNNWTISSTEAGYIDFSDDLGNAIKVVSFLNYLFVFRDYGIMRLTAYGDQNDFLMKKVFTDTGRIYKNSIVSCGDKIMFCAEDGVYAFDGYEAVKVGKEFPKITDKKTVCAGYLDNKYYLACKLAQPGDLKNDSVIRFDTETKDISVLADVQVAGFCCLKSAKDATLLCYFTGDNKNKLGMMSESGKVFETITTKIYESPENTLGSPYYKTIRGASVFTKYPITLKVILDGKEYKFNIAAKDTQQYIPIEKCGIRVKFEIEAQTAHAYVSPISVDVDVERRTL